MYRVFVCCKQTRTWWGMNASTRTKRSIMAVVLHRWYSLSDIVSYYAVYHIFHSIILLLNGYMRPPYILLIPEPTITVTTEEVRKELANCNIYKSTGPGDISCRRMKDLAIEVCKLYCDTDSVCSRSSLYIWALTLSLTAHKSMTSAVNIDFYIFSFWWIGGFYYMCAI